MMVQVSYTSVRSIRGAYIHLGACSPTSRPVPHCITYTYFVIGNCSSYNMYIIIVHGKDLCILFFYTDSVKEKFPEHDSHKLVASLNQKCRDAKLENKMKEV